MLAPYIQEHVDAGETLKFVYITNDLSSPYTAAQRVGVEQAIADLGVEAELQGPPTGAAQDQVALIQTLIAQGEVDGIAVAAVNVDSLKPVIQDAFDAGIPFISVFTDQPDSAQLAFIGEDNRAFGEYEGQLLAEELAGQSGPVVAISVDTAAGWSMARMEGLEAGLATNPDLEFVGPINTGIEPGQMFNAIQNAMQANPGCDRHRIGRLLQHRRGGQVGRGCRPRRRHRHRRHRCSRADVVVHRRRDDHVLDQPGSGRSGVHCDLAAQCVRHRGHAPADNADAADPGDPGERSDGRARRLTLAP